MRRLQHHSQVLLANKVVRFLLVGGLAALTNFTSRFFYNVYVDFSIAVVLAYITGMITAYVLNKYFVFTSSGNTVTQEVGWFVVVNIFALAQTWGLSVYLAQILPDYKPFEGHDGQALADAVAHGAGVLLPVFTSYLGHKYLTFRE